MKRGRENRAAYAATRSSPLCFGCRLCRRNDLANRIVAVHQIELAQSAVERKLNDVSLLYRSPLAGV
jgi:hypothetical protein